MNMNLTLVGQAISFAIFVFICMKYIWPFITKALEERQKRIAESLDAASRATRDLELAREKAAQVLRENKQQASTIIEEAHKTANQMIEDAKLAAKVEGDKMIAFAKGEIAQEISQAKEALRAELSNLVVLGASQILQEDVDSKVHSKIIDDLVARL